MSNTTKSQGTSNELEDDKTSKQNSRSAPNTSRDGNSDDEELSKEMQIALLKEKLSFTEKQLSDKDLQLEHYKQLVKTLRDILSEMSGKQKQASNPVAAPAPVATPAAAAPSGRTANPAPPGFEEPKPRGNSYSIKGRKVKSFHGPEYYSKEDEPFTITRGGGKLSSSTTEDHHDRPTKTQEAPAVVAPAPAQSFASVASHPPAPSNSGNRLAKSQSLHSGISSIAEEEEPKEIPPTSNPNGRSLRPSASSTSTDTKTTKQKTMTAEEAAARKKGGLGRSVSMPLLSNLVDTKFP